jgi:arginine N-succinyltransferase
VIRVRDAESRDVEDLYALARTATFLNLPADRSLLAKKITRSQNSFRKKQRSMADAQYLLVLEDTEENRVIGSCSIIAQHGTPEEPHSYFEVLTKKKISKSLHIGFLHQVLRMGFDTDGPTEIGGLVILPEYRRHPERLGKLLSFSRFMYIAARRAQFREDVLSELMPPLNERGDSPIWEEVGRKFTNLRYDEADRLSRKNKEFFSALFPEGDIYTCMLSGEARQAIGEVGEDTMPVKRMLEGIGFKYRDMIDPFDGGPHFWAKTAQIEPVKFTRQLRPLGKKPLKELPLAHGYLMGISKRKLRLIQGSFRVKGSELAVDGNVQSALDPDESTEFYFLEMKDGRPQRESKKS